MGSVDFWKLVECVALWSHSPRNSKDSFDILKIWKSKKSVTIQCKYVVFWCVGNDLLALAVLFWAEKQNMWENHSFFVPKKQITKIFEVQTELNRSKGHTQQLTVSPQTVKAMLSRDALKLQVDWTRNGNAWQWKLHLTGKDVDGFLHHFGLGEEDFVLSYSYPINIPYGMFSRNWNKKNWIIFKANQKQTSHHIQQHPPNSIWKRCVFLCTSSESSPESKRLQSFGLQVARILCTSCAPAPQRQKDQNHKKKQQISNIPNIHWLYWTIADVCSLQRTWTIMPMCSFWSHFFFWPLLILQNTLCGITSISSCGINGINTI